MSRRKSAPAAKARGAGRAAAPARGVYVQQPKSDIYVAMLGIALGAIIIGCLLMVLLWGDYGYSSDATALLTPAGNPLATSPSSFLVEIPTILG